MKKAFLTALITATVVGWWGGMVLAAEFEIFGKGGTVNVTDGAINEGHKSMAGLGVSVASDPKKDFQGVVSLEGYKMWEKADEDGEIPGKGLGLLFEGRRNYYFGNWRLYPYLGAGLRYWTREGSEKTEGQWRSLAFIEGKAGLGAENKFVYAKGGVCRPLWIDDAKTDPGLGFESEVGVKIKKFRIGVFYDRFGFNSGNNFNVNFWGGRIGFIF